MHHILESPSFLSDFSPSPPLSLPVPLNPPIALSRDPAPQKENVDSPSELAFAQEMKELRSGVVATVPAILKKEEEAREKLAKQKEKEEALQLGLAMGNLNSAGGGGAGSGANEGTPIAGIGGGGGKRRRVEMRQSKAKQNHQQQLMMKGVNQGEYLCLVFLTFQKKSPVPLIQSRCGLFVFSPLEILPLGWEKEDWDSPVPKTSSLPRKLSFHFPGHLSN
jgi:hypothetical protein